MSGTPLPGSITTVSGVNVGLVHDQVHDRGHDHHKRDAKTKTAKRQWFRFPRRASWRSESCDGYSILILSSTSYTVSSAIAVRSLDAMGVFIDWGLQKSPLRAVTSCRGSIDEWLPLGCQTHALCGFYNVGYGSVMDSC